MEQDTKKTFRRRRTQAQIQQLLSQFAKSNVSVADFCKTNDIYPANFHKWKSRYKKQDKPTPVSGFAVLDISSPGLFAEVNGIRIYQLVDAAYLKELR